MYKVLPPQTIKRPNETSPPKAFLGVYSHTSSKPVRQGPRRGSGGGLQRFSLKILPFLSAGKKKPMKIKCTFLKSIASDDHNQNMKTKALTV